MAQPLARQEPNVNNGIEAAAQNLEKAFARLEAAVAHVSTRQNSLKEAQEKLNHLLQEANEKSAQLKQVTGTVIKRLNHTIEKLESAEE
jgi:exonuclease VII small subunit